MEEGSAADVGPKESRQPQESWEPEKTAAVWTETVTVRGAAAANVYCATPAFLPEFSAGPLVKGLSRFGSLFSTPEEKKSQSDEPERLKCSKEQPFWPIVSNNGII